MAPRSIPPPRPRGIPAAVHPPRSALRRNAALIVAAALAAVASALLAGHWAGDAAAPAPPVSDSGQRTVRAGRAELAVPHAWTSAPAKSAAIDGLDLARAAVLAPSAGLSARAVVTLDPADDASLVPAVLRNVVGGALPAPRRTRLAGQPAWLYPALPVTGDRKMDLTVLPTSAGVLAVACVAPRFAWSAAVGCADAIAGLRIPGATIFAPARNLMLRLRLPAVVTTLDRARLNGRRALRAARTRPGQARAAGRLARAHRVATAAVLPLAGSDGAALVQALRATVTAYDRLARAAAHGWPGRYRAARHSVARADTRLDRAVRQLGLASS